MLFKHHVSWSVIVSYFSFVALNSWPSSMIESDKQNTRWILECIAKVVSIIWRGSAIFENNSVCNICDIKVVRCFNYSLTETALASVYNNFFQAFNSFTILNGDSTIFS